MVNYLEAVGVTTTGQQFYQLSPAELIEKALQNHEGKLASTGALVVETGKYTGRSPNDRFIVDTPSTHDKIDWGSVNRPISPEVFDKIFEKAKAYLADKNIYIFDGQVGADAQYALRVRIINELASQNLFIHQLLIRPTEKQLQNFEPEFTVIAVPGLKLGSQADGVNSEAAILLNFDKKIILIAATQYSGEIKKSLFTTMNYLMPERNVFPMHCSANMGSDGKTTLFFGLSGTGKTTLSADPNRTLIGDDEHGWSERGIFNFEGGCYAKAIKLSQKNEPEIWDAIRFGALAENVVLKLDSRDIDYDDDSLTENTRVGYPINFIAHASTRGVGAHPSTVIFLTADAYGVLPAVSKLTMEQAQYHFISGYTSKLAGTERGIKEPQAAFSRCFGSPFMPRKSADYAHLLKDRIDAHKVNVYLINTGWQGGSYGIGERISIPHTRAMVTAAITGDLEKQSFWIHPIFNVLVPHHCPGVPHDILDPRESWDDKDAYDKAAANLAAQFVENFRQFPDVAHLATVGPRVAVVS